MVSTNGILAHICSGPPTLLLQPVQRGIESKGLKLAVPPSFPSFPCNTAALEQRRPPLGIRTLPTQHLRTQHLPGDNGF